MVDLNLTPEQKVQLDALNAYYGDKNAQAQMEKEAATNGLGLSADKLVRLGALNKYYGDLKQKQQNDWIPHPINDARDLAQGAVQGAVNLGGLVNKGETALVNKAFGTNLGAPDVSNIAAPIGSGKDGVQASLSRGIGEYLAPGGAVTKMARPVSLLGKMIADGGAGALSGASNSPDSMGSSSLINGIVGALTPAALKGAQALVPSKLLRGALTPEQLSSNLQAANQTGTGLGDVIGNKMLKSSLETMAPSFPFTGATNAMIKTVGQLKSKATDTLNQLSSGNKPDDAMQAIQDALRQSKKEVLNQKGALETQLNKAADDSGVLVGRKNQMSYAQNKLKEIQEDPELQSYVPKEVMNDLQAHASGEYGDQKLKSADISGGNTALGSQANKYFNAGDSYSGGIYNDLIDAKKEDVQEALDGASDENVKSLRDNYRKFYANEYSPYMDKDIDKFIKYGKGDTDTILSQFLRRNQSQDRSKQLDKLMSKLGSNQKGLVTHAYYSPAINKANGDVDLGMLRSLHEKLGPRQKEVLFSNKDNEKAMDDVVHGININPEPLRALSNAQTGARSSQWAPLATSLAAMGKGFAVGGIPGALIGGAVGIIGPAIAGKGVTKTLTSEKIRQSLVNEMLKNRNRIYTPKKVQGANTLAQGIANALQGNN